MGYIALKRFPVGDSHSVPGELCKEVEGWKDPKKWVSWGYIIAEKDFDPKVHLKGVMAKKSDAQKPKVVEAEPNESSEASTTSEPKPDKKVTKKKGSKKSAKG